MSKNCGDLFVALQGALSLVQLVDKFLNDRYLLNWSSPSHDLAVSQNISYLAVLFKTKRTSCIARQNALVESSSKIWHTEQTSQFLLKLFYASSHTWTG